MRSVSSLTIALAGNPNSGKTTIFNALTGLRQKVGNYPGVTVEKKTGRCALPDGRMVNIVDLPGTYSLISRSPDEHVAMEIVRGLRPDTPVPDVVVVVVDASNLQRNLYLVSQLIEVGRPMVIALNMMDVAERRGINVSPEALEEQLGVPVVAVVGHQRKGISDLKFKISNARVAPLPEFSLPQPMRDEVTQIGERIFQMDHRRDDPIHHARSRVIAERLLIGDRGDDIAGLASDASVSALLKQSNDRLTALGIDPMQADVEAHYRWIEDVSRASVIPDQPIATLDYRSRDRHLTEQVDAILIHKIWGLLFFAGVMAALFVAVFFVADPMMGAMEDGVGAVGSFVAQWLPAGPIHDLWTDGIVAGVGAVIVFVPQIALLFLFLAVLEDSGYLARAAFLMDRVLRGVGLHGKSFIPLLSSFACAIPGIMATRTIENRRDRLATIFVAPFMSCSARLPVYFLLIGTFFATFSPAARGGLMFSLYALGVIAAALTALVFKRTLLKGRPQAFILEMPTYKIPQLSQVARQVWTSTKAFVVKAGTIIFCLSVILWAMTYYPRLPEEQVNALNERSQHDVQRLDRHHPWAAAPRPEAFDSPADEFEFNRLASQFRDEVSYKDPDLRSKWLAKLESPRDESIASAQLRHSLAGRFGHLIEPVIRPLGYDWKMGVGLVGAFAAREVFVSTMAITYNAGSEDETQPLASAMLKDRYPDGSRVWTPLVAASLLVWFVLAMQCMSTLAIVKRETGGWAWPIFMLIYMNGLAYVVCLGIYQIGSTWFA